MQTDGTFRWLGRPGRFPTPPAFKDLDRAAVRAHLVQQTRQFLYANFYVHGRPVEPSSRPAKRIGSHSRFVQAILSSDQGRNEWQHVGLVSSIDGDRVTIERGALKLQARADECTSMTSPLRPGAAVQLRLGRSSLRTSPGFCMVSGEQPIKGADPQFRFYWNLTADKAAAFVKEATGYLNTSGHAFYLKVLTDPLGYDRCDAGVLYVERRHAAEIWDDVVRIYRAVGPLGAGTPAFTRPLAPGLAAADDPGKGESFGTFCCGLLAEASMQIAELQVTATEPRLAIANGVFRLAGIDPERPYLRPGQAEPSFAALQRSETLLPADADRRPTKAGKPSASNADWLGAATRIGMKIASEALWYRDRCQWVGANPLPGKGAAAIDYRTLPAGLYSGSAGIALFLAELAVRTGESVLRSTALGTIRQALSRTGSEIGLYPGDTGIALVAARIGALLGECWLSERGDALARRVLQYDLVSNQNDLLYGAAGRVVGALALDKLLDLPGGEAAVRYGEALLESAHRSDAGLSWSGSDRRWTHNLTGLSHGAAGVAHALALLWQRTGDERFRAAALDAVRYEQSQFSAAVNNWPDLRPWPAGEQREEQRFACFWCHGAPGIALQRLAFASLVDDSAFVDQARVGFATTADKLARTLTRNVENYSLCHGVLGNAEALNAWTTLGWSPGYADLVDSAAREGLRLYGESGRWPCGTIEGDTPSLMLGRAGIGYFYLRLFAPEVPSVLLIDPAVWKM